jgi:hypothetical protein
MLIKTALGDARVPSAANKLDNLGSTDGIQNRRTKVAPTWNAACAGAIFWRQIFWWQQRERLSGQ